MTTDRGDTRSRVVHVLRRGPATLDDLVNELGLTRTAVRLQLAVLERDGSVVRRGMRRGRTKPAHVYELTTQAEQRLSRAYIPVLTQLLHVLAARLSSAEFDAVMRDVGRELLAGQPRPRGPLKARAQAASDLLNELGGLTDVSEEGPDLMIRSHGCPLAAAAIHHPETCNAMESLVTEFVGATVRQRCDRTDRPRCRFLIAGEDDSSAA
ncbi:MAG TPA: ArsR family transcriptional regulator [Gemmatimonadaceae bacterium]|nr:ArsR family transcriptional regulator [Gemmatimonadaceae bacterium]